MSDSEESSSDGGDAPPSQPVVTVAMGRSRRANAGNRMAALLEKAEQDDFYKTTYLGFDESVEDDDPDFA
jgi:vacuolar protein sorting-associated protein 72